MKEEEEIAGFGHDLVFSICFCTLLVTFGPCITPYYLPLTLVGLTDLVVFVKYICEIHKQSVQSEDWNVRKDSITRQLIIRNKPVGIPGRSQQDLKRFQMYALELRDKPNMKQSKHLKKLEKSYHLSFDLGK